MTRSYQVLVAVLICLGVAATLQLPHERVVRAEDKLVPEASAGRYQMFKNPRIGKPNEECLLDTATGKVWALSFDEKQKGKWVLAIEGPK